MLSGSMLHRVCLIAALLLGAESASLRAAPAKPAEAAAAPKVAEKKEAAKVAAPQVVAESVANTIAKALAANVSAHASADKVPATAAAGTTTHQKLDVGFQDFEKNLTTEISKKLLASASGPEWNDEMRANFTKNVTGALKESLNVILKPLKQSIGKTWMALPKDEQKDEYVVTLKSSFAPVFERSMDAVNSHLELGLNRVKAMSKEKTAMNSTQILDKAEFSIADSLLTEHCYEVSPSKSLKSMKKPANASALADKKKFCIQSVIGTLAHRLNDTQGLISMSMRFDAGAMSLAQRALKKGIH